MSERFQRRLATQLFKDSPETTRLLDALSSGTAGRGSIIWCRHQAEDLPFHIPLRETWLPANVDAVTDTERPGAHPLHDEGAYYCADLSSVWAASAIQEIQPELPRAFVLDLCASPGGKSIFAWRALEPALLLANEPIKKRLGALVGNFTRCHVSSAAIAASDSSFFAEHAKAAFDLTLVDAPCSGQSLVARGLEARDAFHPLVISRNSARQRRILANAAHTVRPGGYLLYMTCTFSREENERVIEWFLKKHGEFSAHPVKSHADFQSAFSDFPAYRLWPWQGFGAGGFIALLRRAGSAERAPLRADDFFTVWSSAPGWEVKRLRELPQGDRGGGSGVQRARTRRRRDRQSNR